MTDKRPEAAASPPDTGTTPVLPVKLRPELRRIQRFGWGLFLVWSAILVAVAVVKPDPYAGSWRLVLELLFLGQAVSIADGIADGFGSAYLMFQNGLQDIVLVLILYPWVVAAYEGVAGYRPLRRTIERVRRIAEANRKVVEPWGVIGLWAFVFFPFWSTGALVGSVVGYLLGMRTPVVFSTVFAGHLVSVASLVWLFDSTRDMLASLERGWVRFLPWVVLAVLFLGTLAWKAIKSAFAATRSGTSRNGPSRSRQR